MGRDESAGPPTETVVVLDVPDEPAPAESTPTDPAPAEPAPARPVPGPRAARRPGARTVVAVLAAVVGLAAVVVAGLVAVAPVDASTSTLTWPRTGEAPGPTTAFLVPYRPATLDATVPCRAVREGLRRKAATALLATTTSGAGRGLVVRVERGDLQVLVGGRRVPVDVPAGECALRIRADAAGVTVTAGADTPVVLAGDPVPEVFAVTTDLTGPVSAGLALTARTPSWFDNAASPQKEALVALQLRLAAVALGLLVVLGVLGPAVAGRSAGAGPLLTRLHEAPRTGPGAARRAAGAVPARLRTWATARARSAGHRATALRSAGMPGAAGALGVVGRLAVDVVVGVTLVWWSVVGPLTDDDGFASVIAQRAGDGDQIGNYYRWFNASEAPFSTVQQVLSWWFDLGLSPVALRTPSVLAGFALWLVVTRGVLRPTLGPAGRSVGVRCLAAVALGAWWLPYDLGTRPEPLVALGATTVLALVLRAVGEAARHREALLGVAVLVAGLTVTVAPSGLVAAAPIVLCAPRVLRLLWTGSPVGADERPATGEDAGGVLLLVARLAVLAGLAAVAVTVVFATQSWHGVLVSTAVHDQIGPSQPWYAEWLRYGYLFGEDHWGSATKRLPVLLTLVLALPALVLLVRRGSARRGMLGRETPALLALAPVAFVLLAVTPSKWSHHFGALAGFGAVAVVAVVVALVRAATAGRGDVVLRATGVVTTLGVALAAAFAFSGPNTWWAYSNIGMPWATGPVDPFDSPALWVVAAVVVAALVGPHALLRRTRDGGTTSARTRVATLVPAVLAVLVAATSTGVLVGSFATAADRGGDFWSLAVQNRAAPGSPAADGLQSRVQVLTTADGGPLTPVAGSTATLEGFVDDGGYDVAPPARPAPLRAPGDRSPQDPPDDRSVWGSRDGGDGTVGELTSPWFGLPRPGDGQELATSVAGRTDDGGSVTWEFGRGNTVVGERAVLEAPEPERGYRGYAADADQARLQDQDRDRSAWRTVTVVADDIPAGADRVRLRATDDRSDDGGWVAVTGPRIVDVTPLTRYLDDRGPVLVDWAIAFAWPGRLDFPRVARGVATAPGAMITGPSAPDDPVGQLRTADATAPGDIVPERWTLGTLGLATGTDTGGSFGGVDEAGTVAEADTRLAGEPERRWGRVLVPDYGDLARDGYGVAVTTTRIGGTEGDPAPVREPRPTGSP